jgi:hypothetical protein
MKNFDEACQAAEDKILDIAERVPIKRGQIPRGSLATIIGFFVKMPTWQPMATAKRDIALRILGNNTSEFTYYGAWMDGAWRVFTARGLLEFSPTHWQPLPDPPESELDSSDCGLYDKEKAN